MSWRCKNPNRVEVLAEGFISVCLELAAGFDERELIDKLKAFDSRPLAFLQRPRRLHLRVEEAHGGSTWESVLRRHQKSVRLCIPPHWYSGTEAKLVTAATTTIRFYYLRG